MNLKLQKGQLLIAEPNILNDFSFRKTIILLTEHSNKSSVGFILNRPTQYILNNLLVDVKCDFTVYNGGPVEQDNLYFIHRIPHLLKGSLKLSGGIYWGGNFEQLQFLLNEKLIKDKDIRFFLGYSGWGINQLEEELDTNSWFVAENTYNNILSEKTDLIWKDQLLKKGGKYTIWANAPDNVQMN